MFSTSIQIKELILKIKAVSTLITKLFSFVNNNNFNWALKKKKAFTLPVHEDPINFIRTSDLSCHIKHQSLQTIKLKVLHKNRGPRSLSALRKILKWLTQFQRVLPTLKMFQWWTLMTSNWILKTFKSQNPFKCRIRTTFLYKMLILLIFNKNRVILWTKCYQIWTWGWIARR